MEQRRLGASGFQVPALSLGTGTFGGGNEFFAAWGSTDADGARRLVDICLESGLNLFDTADIYSRGQAEQVLGQAIAGRRDKVLVSTKATFRMGDGPNDVGSSRHHLRASVEGSLKRLGTDYIDLFQLHGFDAKTPIEETLYTLDGLVREGKIRYLGVSNFSGWHLMKSLALSEKHSLQRYVAHQAYYSLVGRDYEWELMPLGLDQGVSAVVWSPLGWGRLTGKIRRGTGIPAQSRLHTTAGGQRVPVQGGGRARGRRRGSGQVGAAGGAELAAATSDGGLGDRGRARREAAAREPGRDRLEPHGRTGEEARRRQRGDAALSVLAPERIQGAQSGAGVS